MVTKVQKWGNSQGLRLASKGVSCQAKPVLKLSIDVPTNGPEGGLQRVANVQDGDRSGHGFHRIPKPGDPAET